MPDPIVTDITLLPPTEGAPASGQTPEQLRTLAAQFESLLIGQMMRDLRESMFDKEEDQANGFGGGPLGDAIFSELSIALSRAGGVGLGRSLIGPLMNEAGIEAPAMSAESAAAPAMAAAFDPAAAVARPNVMSAAMPGRLSSAYGWRRDPMSGDIKFHKGLDLAMPVGQELPAARAGQVEFAGEIEGYGLTVVVKHDDRLSTRYAHLSEVLVKTGDHVEAGQTIARSGATGRTTGPHLHFEVLDRGQAVDPTGEWSR